MPNKVGAAAAGVHLRRGPRQLVPDEVSFYQDRVLPRLVDVALGRPFDPIRARVAAPLDGTVLEVGFGSGLNVPHYPAAVSKVVAVDPSLVGRKLAEGRLAASPIPVEFAGTDGQDLPLDDGIVDHALITWTLCTIPDPSRSLAEMHRVLKRGGHLHFVEHGLSPNPRAARWQHGLTPVWRHFAGGCHLDRPIDRLITSAGFALVQLDRYRFSWPEPFTYLYEGVAEKP
jgi:SAM-dependent methyltransferase